MMNMNLKKGQFYLFEYLSKEINLDSLLYTRDSDVEVTLLTYSKILGFDIKDALENSFDIKEHFVLKKDAPPRRRFNKAFLEMDDIYVIKLRALNANTNIDFALFDSKKPLIIPHKKIVNFAMDKDQT